MLQHRCLRKQRYFVRKEREIPPIRYFYRIAATYFSTVRFFPEEPHGSTSQTVIELSNVCNGSRKVRQLHGFGDAK
jgi:hypothetical protein